MCIKFQAVWFILGVVISSVGLSQLNTNLDEIRAAKMEKQQVVLGHRIGPNGQEILVVR